MQTLKTIAEMVEKADKGIHCTIDEYSNQIIATFEKRPEVEIALLTPYMQGKVKKGQIDMDSLTEMLFSVRRIANA